MKRILLVLIFLFFSKSLYGTLTDLEKLKQGFVLETKQIKISSYPDAFNPSIVRWNGSILLCFRARDPATGLSNFIGVIELDEKYRPKGKVRPLKIQHDELSAGLVQDPRLIVVKEKLYLIYSDMWKLPNESVRRVYISEVIFDGEKYVGYNPEVQLRFNGIKDNKFEKNWVPFEYNGNLLLAYSINPHKIFFPVLGKKKCLTVACTEIENIWEWGELRGGTPALVIDNYYLAFFHSSKMMKTTHSKGKLMPHYVMGAYVFERHPPFSLSKMSPKIIVGENFYNGPDYNTWKPLRVVFPCGFITDKNNIIISYGRQDHEMWIVKLDKKGLLKSLIPVQRKF
jgi:predicted GH43/DUF377 family glycosyl hydrolase